MIRLFNSGHPPFSPPSSGIIKGVLTFKLETGACPEPAEGTDF